MCLVCGIQNLKHELVKDLSQGTRFSGVTIGGQGGGGTAAGFWRIYRLSTNKKLKVWTQYRLLHSFKKIYGTAWRGKLWFLGSKSVIQMIKQKWPYYKSEHAFKLQRLPEISQRLPMNPSEQIQTPSTHWPLFSHGTTHSTTVIKREHNQ